MTWSSDDSYGEAGLKHWFILQLWSLVWLWLHHEARCWGEEEARDDGDEGRGSDATMVQPGGVGEREGN